MTIQHASRVDSLRGNLLRVAFTLAQEEFKRRRGEFHATHTAPLGESDFAEEAVRLTAALRSHLASLPDLGLRTLRTQLAEALLVEIDHNMAGSGHVPGNRADLSNVTAETNCSGAGRGGKVALVSLPWMSPAMPSIQLATLASALARNQIASDVHELYVDFAARIGLNLYNHLSNLLGFLPEWVFSRHYYGPEQDDYLASMLAAEPLACNTPCPELEDLILEALEPVTESYLDDVVNMVDWSRYDIIGCSLTISQLGASMAFVRRVKLRYPGIKIVFGGSQCAGIMGKTILKICRYVDTVVHVEGEQLLPELVRRFRDGHDLAGLAGISYRNETDDIVSGPAGSLYRQQNERLPLNYDSYFQRLVRLNLTDKLNPWLPFEGSRGCWYGQKSQCTFCGLHEIMTFRAWSPDSVIQELERLYARYGIGRFYAMDLILPREFLSSLLPEIVRRGHDWMIFYEIKSNVRREEIELMAQAGIRWIQPGIESLDLDLLKLMRKGVSPLQNIQLLKWSKEVGIFCGWNLLFGLPGETEASYENMAQLIPRLVHLRPPSGGGQFQLHRFSPYFDHPEEFGIRRRRPHPMFEHVFPVGEELLADLVYLHEFELDTGIRRVDHSAVLQATEAWRRSYRQGAMLQITMRENGTSGILDTRRPDAVPLSYELDVAETALYLFLDGAIGKNVLPQKFADAHPVEAAQLTRRGLDGVLERWIERDLVLEMDGKLLALAIRASGLEPHTPAVRTRPERQPQVHPGGALV